MLRGVARASLRPRGPRCAGVGLYVAAPLRTYATQRTSRLSYASKILADPVVETIVIISRVVRILLGSALVVGGISLTAWEGVHQYVEHVAMPQARPSVQHLDALEPGDAFGIATDVRLDEWTHCYRTDPRLGMFGRHILRAAWMAQHWGSGITPSVMFGNRVGGVPATKQVDINVATRNQGLLMAEQFLNTTLSIAEKRRIFVPDDAHSQTPADPEAVRLELWLASIRQQLGTTPALQRATLACEKLFDVVPDDALRTLLATRLGTEWGLLNKPNEGMAWFDRAMKLGGMHMTVATSIKKLLAHKVPALTPRDERVALSVLQSVSAFYAHQAKHHEHSARRAWLVDALRAQLAALTLADKVTTRTYTPPSNESMLHKLWAEQRQCVMAVYVAETLYALQAQSPAGLWQKIRRAVSPTLLDASPVQYVHGLASNPAPVPPGMHDQSRAWLMVARDKSAYIQAQLTGHSGSFAQCIAKDAKLVHEEATRLLNALEQRT